MNPWLWIILAGIITFAIRFSFIFLLGKIDLPQWFQRSLRYVPAAVLSAIILPEMVFYQGKFDVSWHNPQWLAGAVAVIVAFWTRSMLWTVGVGMAVFMLLHSMLPY